MNRVIRLGFLIPCDLYGKFFVVVVFFAALYIAGFGICLFLLYNLMPFVMQFSSATVVNLSLLTADFYSLLCGLLLFHYKVGELVSFYIFLICTVLFVEYYTLFAGVF